MNDNDSALNVLVKGIASSMKQMISKAKFNKGVTGIVIETISETKYVVSIGDEVYIANSRIPLNVNDVVKMIKWNNNYNELYVIF